MLKQDVSNAYSYFRRHDNMPVKDLVRSEKTKEGMKNITRSVVHKIEVKDGNFVACVGFFL